MQKDRLRRKGIPEERLKDGLINSFGGKILKSQGWQEGEKLGDHGICDPIAPDYRYSRYSKNKVFFVFKSRSLKNTSLKTSTERPWIGLLWHENKR